MVSIINRGNDSTSNIALGVCTAALAISAAVICKHSVSSISKNIAQTRKFKAFNNMKEFSSLTRKQKRECYSFLEYEGACVLPTIRGVKPACTFGVADKKDLQAVLNLKKGHFQKPLDFVKTECNKNGKYSVHIFNKDEVFKVIDRNKEIFTARLNLPSNAQTSTIYEQLRNTLHYSVINNHTKDLLGMTLGYPKYSTMIATLSSVGNIPDGLVKNPAEFKKAILNVLKSDKSPYKNLSQAEKDKLIEAVNNIETIGPNKVGRPIYPFGQFTPEPEEFERISNAVEQFKTINPELYDLCTKEYVI